MEPRRFRGDPKNEWDERDRAQCCPTVLTCLTAHPMILVYSPNRLRAATGRLALDTCTAQSAPQDRLNRNAPDPSASKPAQEASTIGHPCAVCRGRPTGPGERGILPPGCRFTMRPAPEPLRSSLHRCSASDDMTGVVTPEPNGLKRYLPSRPDTGSSARRPAASQTRPRARDESCPWQ